MSPEKSKSPGQTFYDEQVDYLVRGDVDGLIDNHYAADAELIGFEFVVRGRDALKTHFRQYLKGLPGLKLVSTEKFRESEDALFFEATVHTDNGRAGVYDAFVLRDGKATHHFTGLLSFTPNA
ncbi:MAG TPA: nuclear transport factor 2 family protein [Candidatus Dormibacteraeota bacterium]|jgi:hypothetical protein